MWRWRNAFACFAPEAHAIVRYVRYRIPRANPERAPGINNVFDQDPPIVSQVVARAPFGNGNTYPVLYDAMGRKIFLTLTAKF